LKRALLSLCVFGAFTAQSSLIAAPADGATPPTPPKGYKRMFTTGPKKGPKASIRIEDALIQADAATTIPLWSYNVTSPVDGKKYAGTMVGRNPYYHGHRTTTVQTYLIPVRMTFEDTGTVFDPTVNTGCDADSVVNLVSHSPIFQSSNYTMNGVALGTGQYVDQFQRASFWSVVKGTPYHTSLKLTVPGYVNVSVPIQYGSTNGFFGCLYGLIDINWWDNLVQTQILPTLAKQGIGPTSLPALIFDSVFQYDGDPSNCCILGYHNSYTTSSGAFQSYSTTSWDTSGTFGGDISITTHEVAEWLDDPNTVNATPAWGHTGQVPGCQDNLEVGDPLTGTYFPTVTLNNYDYNPQELVFYSWFFRQNPSIAAGGIYSNNGTLTSSQSSVCQ
jgi:hypothetical protein